MQNEIIEIDKLSDLKEVYAERPNIFYSAFIYVLLLMIIIALGFCSIFEIDIVINAEGIIRPNDNIGTVVPITTGKIENVYFKDGQNVNKGDKLIEVNMNDSKILLSNLTEQRDFLNSEKIFLEKYLDSVKLTTNLFDSSRDSEEYKYYVKFEQYLINFNKSKAAIEQDVKQIELKLNELDDKIETNKKSLEGLNLYKKAILEEDDSYVDNYPEYQLLYKQYLNTMRNIDNEYDSEILNKDVDVSISTNKSNEIYYNDKLNEYKLLVSSIKDNVSKFSENSTSTCKYLFEEYILTFEQYNSLSSDGMITTAAKAYRNSKIAEYQEMVNNLEEKIKNLSYERKNLKHLQNNINIIEEDHINSLNSLNYNAINSITEKINEIEENLAALENEKRSKQIIKDIYNQNKDKDGNYISVNEITINEINNCLDNIDEIDLTIKDVESEMEKYNNQIKEANILASIDGTVNEIVPVSVGDLVTAGEIIATIVPRDTSEFKMKIYVNNSDIGNIKVGNEVKYNIYALPQTQYGLASGVIYKISPDTVMSENANSGYYLVECSVDQIQLKKYDGAFSNIAIGMQAKCKIVTSKKTILRYFFEKINLF